LTTHFDVRVEPTVGSVTRVTVRGEVDAATSERCSRHGKSTGAGYDSRAERDPRLLRHDR
jgi:hypothetical protein